MNAIAKLEFELTYNDVSGHHISHYITVTTAIYIYIYIYAWCNGYRLRKWTRRHEFKSWTRLIAFHIALIPLGKE